MLGTGSSLGLFGSNGSDQATKKSWPNSYDVKVHPDSSDEELMASLREDEKEVNSDEDEEGLAGELAAFEGNREECKLVLVVRTDLGMGKGTLCSIYIDVHIFCMEYC